jgi:intergrase/recombinase
MIGKPLKWGCKMGIMRMWEKWSQKQWDNWGSKLQNKYDKYRTLETPDWYQELTEDVWERLDDGTKKWLNEFLEFVKNKFTDAHAKDLVEKALRLLKKYL